MSIPVTAGNFTPFGAFAGRRGDSQQAEGAARREDAAGAPFRPQSFRPRTPTPAPGPVQTASDSQTGEGAAAVFAGADLRNAVARRSPLTEAEQAQLRELRARDREVRAHEAAHAAIGGPYASAPSYSFQAGPDGRLYAVGGSVSIDVSPVPGDPAATVVKMRIVRAAALAPSRPSQSDRQIAARASRELSRATRELAQERRETNVPVLDDARLTDGESQQSTAASAPVDARIEKALATYRRIAGLKPE